MKHKLFSLLLAIVAGTSFAFAESGTCGEHLTWELTDGTLTISGIGDMTNYDWGGAPWYSYSRYITSLSIDDGVTSIGNYAFQNCSSLISVTIPNSVTSIGSNAFYYCSSLTSIQVDAANSAYCDIDGVLFSKDEKTLVIYPIGKTTSYIIPNSVTRIGDNAFYSCRSLTSVTIPNSVISIGDYAFYSCKSLTSVTIPNSVTSIGKGAFLFCSSLISVTIPNSVTNIRDLAFGDCSSLTSIQVDAANSAYCDIDGVLFSKDKKTLIQYSSGKTATSYTIPNSVTRIGSSAFYNCINLTSVTIPNSVTNIESNAFVYCSNLTFVTIPNSVIIIEYYAFSDCYGLTSVTIPNSVTHIGSGAFYGCNSLTSVTNYAAKPQEINDVFYDVDLSAVTLYVPKESLKKYENADVWKDFGSKVAISAEQTETEEMTVIPNNNSVEITWPEVTSAATYELIIKDKNDNVICTLVFDSEGKLLSIAFSAPSRNHSPEYAQSSGFRFTVTDLESGTYYTYTMTAKDSDGNTIGVPHSSAFTTTGTATGVEEAERDAAAAVRKVMRDGVMYIVMPDGRMYDMQGAEVR